MTRLFLDTNVLIDFFQRRAPHYQDVVKLRIAREFGDVELWCSTKSFTDIFYVLKKMAPPDRIQDAFAASAGFLQMCSIDQGDVVRAAEQKWSDFEDCLINVAAEKTKADVLITRDASGFGRSRIDVMSPAEFIDWMRVEEGIAYDTVEFRRTKASRDVIPSV